MLKGLALLYFTLFCLEMCVAEKESLPQSCQVVAVPTQVSATEVYQHTGKNGPVGVLKRVYQTVSYLHLNKVIFG